MRNKFIWLIVFLLCALPVEARTPRTITISSDYESVTVNEDSTVSFCYCGPGRRVSVQSDLLYADEDTARYTDRTRRIKMRLGSDGCFHATTRAVSPETYTYCFRVNGKRKPDPLNRDTAWQKMHKWNVVNVGGSERAELYRTPDRQGELIRTSWYSSNEKLRRRVNVYVPSAVSYQPSDVSYQPSEVSYQPSEGERFPVVYLIHGINGYEGSWSERGRAINILENMVAEGLCEPMILVMPDVNFGVHEDKPSHHTLWNNIFNYPRLCHDHDIERSLVELVQMVDSTYPISDKHYIAGLSDGARIAANTANLMPGYFEAIGMFSPVVHKSQLPTDSATVYIYTGKKDMFHPNAKRFNRRMEKAQKPHSYTESIGGHTWRNWRSYLVDFLKNL